MAAKRLTPPIGAYGEYKLAEPWATATGMNYQCTALVKVEEVVKTGRNVFKTYYEPVGLTQEVCDTQIAQGVIFVGLLGADGSRIYVPDTYVLAYPDQSSVNYNYTVLAVDLGPQPASLSLTLLVDELKSVASKFTGINKNLINVKVTTAQSTTMLSKEQAIAAEEARRIAIANVVPTDVVIGRLNARITEQDALIQKLLAQQRT